MTKISTLITAGVVAMFGVAGAIGAVAQAEDPCIVTAGEINMTGSAMCIIEENVDTINYSGTIEEFHAVLHAFRNNAGFGYGTFASNAVFKASITNMFSTSGINAIAADSPVGATVEITPGVADIVYEQAPWILPAGFSIDYDNTIIHLPENTDPNDALTVFGDIDNASIIVAEGNNYTISLEKFQGADVIVLHLPADTSEEDALEFAKGITGFDLVIGVNNNTDFTVTVKDGEDPVVVHYDDEKTDEVVTPPNTGRR